jgi:DNA-binding NarL/FixJ family response regulator
MLPSGAPGHQARPLATSVLPQGGGRERVPLPPRVDTSTATTADSEQDLVASDRDGVLLGCSLSPRELEVVKLIAEGLTSEEIAEQLFISKKTVDRHRANMLEKLGCATASS